MKAQPGHRVVVVGGGFGGLMAARRLKHAHVQVTLVDRTANHVFQPLLYQYATGILSEGQIAPPLRGIFSRHRNIEVDGFVGWLMWLVVHITFLTGCMNRLSASFAWLVALGGHRRSQRAISIADISDAVSGSRPQPGHKDDQTDHPSTPTTRHLHPGAAGGGRLGTQQAGPI